MTPDPKQRFRFPALAAVFLLLAATLVACAEEPAQEGGGPVPDPGDSGDGGPTLPLEVGANGELVIMVPYQGSPDPAAGAIPVVIPPPAVDVYALIDNSGSMGTPQSAIQGTLPSALNDFWCGGGGTPGSCIEDIQYGIGTTGTTLEAPYAHLQDIQPDLATFESGLPAGVSPVSTGSADTQFAALASAITGLGSVALDGTLGCDPGLTYADQNSCGAGRFGYPCFREGALPVILLATDEAPLGESELACPDIPTLSAVVNNAGARVIGLAGGTALANLQDLAVGTETVDEFGDPLVTSAIDAGAVELAAQYVQQLALGTFLLSVNPVDDASDAVNTVNDFVERLETDTTSAGCADELDVDSNADGTPDIFVATLVGTGVCWNLVPRQNTTVEAAADYQVFDLTLEILANGLPVATQDVQFVVPP